MASFRKLTLTVLLSLTTLAATADDTDIYYSSGVITAAEPLLMFNLDYRPNLGNNLCTAGSDCDAQLGTEITSFLTVPDGDQVTSFDAMRAVMASLLTDFEGIKVGLMMSHNNDCNNKQIEKRDAGQLPKCSNGGYILRGFELLEAGDTNGAKQELMDILYAIPTPQGNVSHSMQGKELYFEFYRYLTGQGILNAHLGHTNFTDTDKNTNLDVDFPGASWDTSIESGSNYISPLSSIGSCSGIFAVNILFQVSNQDAQSDDAIAESVANGGMNLTGNQITFDDVIAFTNQSDLETNIDGTQNVKSWFFSTNVNTKTNGYAAAGGTNSAIEWSDDAAGYIQLRKDLLEIGRSILSESSTFVSASVPVNVFNRAEIDTNLFIALFSVDNSGLPSWPGNLKKLRINRELVGGVPTITLEDANGTPAVASDGRIRFDALTLWTDGTILDPPPTHPATAEEQFMVVGKDGRFVTRGGAGQQTPGYRNTDGSFASATTSNGTGTRQLFLEPATGTTLENLDATATRASQLMSEMGLADQNEALDTLTWARGFDPATGVSRKWVLGDAVHSRPTPINYGALGSHTQSNPDIRVVMGTNDGYLHMYRNTLANGNESGEEVWAFMPRAALPELNRLKNNAAPSGGAPYLPPHPYTVDGQVVLHTIDLNNDGTLDHSVGDKVYAFFGERRGGRNYYALDLSNPDDPKYLWTIKGGTGDFTELQMTFSTPQVIDVEYGPNTATTALIFGGGYHGGWDSSTGNRIGKDASYGLDTPDKGNAIYMVEAFTGNLIWKANYTTSTTPVATATTYSTDKMIDSFPSEVQPLDSDGDGFEDRAYVGDTYAQLWRIDFPRSSTTDNRASDWQVVRLADLSDNSPNSNHRRIFHRPDIVQTVINNTTVDVVLIGTGDRAHPKRTFVDDYLFMVKDFNTSTKPDPATWTPVDWTQLGDITNDCFTPTSCTADLSKGWKLKMQDNGEKILSSPVTVRGSIFFTSYLPEGGASGSACAPATGAGRVYNVSLFDGSPERNRNVVDDDGNTQPSTHEDRFSLLDSSGIPSDVVPLSPDDLLLPDLTVEKTSTSSFWKTYWYQSGLDHY